jgi:hypothetical protein
MLHILNFHINLSIINKKNKGTIDIKMKSNKLYIYLAFIFLYMYQTLPWLTQSK